MYNHWKVQMLVLKFYILMKALCVVCLYIRNCHTLQISIFHENIDSDVTANYHQKNKGFYSI